MASKKSSKKSPRGEPQTMEELLAQTGYQLRGFSRGQEVWGTVLEVSPKKLVLDIGGKSEGIVAEKAYEEAADFIKSLKVGDKVQGVVIIPEMERGQTLISLRDAAKQVAFDKLEEAKAKATPVSVLGKTVVRGGVSVEVFGIPGFIPTSQLGTKAVENTSKLLGNNFAAVVLEISRQEGRVILSEKAVSEREILAKQAKILGKIKLGEILAGDVSGVTNFGAFVRIEKGGVWLEGLVHISELSYQKVADPSEIVKVGDKVKVKVLERNEKSGKLSLSIKQTQKDPWEDAGEKFSPEKTVKGKVTRISDWGFFIELEPGVEGLLHFSKIPAGVKLAEGQEITCFIEEVNEKEKKISLGLVLKEKPVGYK